MSDNNPIIDRARAFVFKRCGDSPTWGDISPQLLADYTTRELADRDTELTRLKEENERLQKVVVEAEYALSIDRPGMAMSILTDALTLQATEDAQTEDRQHGR